MYRGKKTGSSGKPASSAHDGMPGRSSGYLGRKTGAAGPPVAANSHTGFPKAASDYRGIKPAAAGSPSPAMPSRHRMAGSTGGGEYVTEHHRGARKG